MSPDGPLDRRMKRWQRQRADARLFRALAAAHDLKRREIRILFAAAERAQLVRKAEIFLRPALLTTNPDPARFGEDDLSRLQARLLGPGTATGDGR